MARMLASIVAFPVIMIGSVAALRWRTSARMSSPWITGMFWSIMTMS